MIYLHQSICSHSIHGSHAELHAGRNSTARPVSFNYDLLNGASVETMRSAEQKKLIYNNIGLLIRNYWKTCDITTCSFEIRYMCIPNDRPSEYKDNLGMTVFKMIFLKITLIRAYVQCTMYTGCNISAYDIEIFSDP